MLSLYQSLSLGIFPLNSVLCGGNLSLRNKIPIRASVGSCYFYRWEKNELLTL